MAIVEEKNLQNSPTNWAEDDPNRKLTKAEADELRETEKLWKESFATIKDMISPAMIRVDAKKLQVGNTFVRTIYTYAYPDVLE